MKIKNLFYYGFLSICLSPVFYSCNSEEMLSQNVTPKEEKAFLDLQNHLKRIGDEYHQKYNTTETRSFKWWSKFFRDCSIFFADASSFISNGSFSAAAETSGKVKAALTPEELLSSSIHKNYLEDKELTLNKIVNPNSLSQLERNSPGFIHNQILLNTYKNNLDSITALSPEQLYNKIFEEGIRATGEKITDEQRLKFKEESDKLAELAKTSPDFESFVEATKKIKNDPRLNLELDILGTVVQGEPLKDPYTGEENKTIRLIKDSKISKDSKRKILDGISVLKGSKELWVTSPLNQ